MGKCRQKEEYTERHLAIYRRKTEDHSALSSIPPESSDWLVGPGERHKQELQLDQTNATSDNGLQQLTLVGVDARRDASEFGPRAGDAGGNFASVRREDLGKGCVIAGLQSRRRSIRGVERVQVLLDPGPATGTGTALVDRRCRRGEVRSRGGDGSVGAESVRVAPAGRRGQPVRRASLDKGPPNERLAPVHGFDDVDVGDVSTR